MNTKANIVKDSWQCHHTPIYEDTEYSVDELRTSIEEFAVYLEAFKKEHTDHTDFKVEYSLEPDSDPWCNNDKEYIVWRISASRPMTEQEVSEEEKLKNKQIEYRKQQYETLKKEFGDK